MILFFLPYRLWLSGRDIFLHKPNVYIGIFAFLAILAGMTNENTVIAIIGMIVIGYFLHRFNVVNTISPPRWFWTGLPFLLFGYSYLLLSPSTKMRRDYYLQAFGISSQGISDFIAKVPEVFKSIFHKFQEFIDNFLYFLFAINYLSKKKYP